MTFFTPTGWKLLTHLCLFLLRNFYVRSALLKRSSQYNTPLSKAKETEARKNCSCPDNWDSPSSLFLKTSQTPAFEICFPPQTPSRASYAQVFIMSERLDLRETLMFKLTGSRFSRMKCSSPDLQLISMQIISTSFQTVQRTTITLDHRGGQKYKCLMLMLD